MEYSTAVMKNDAMIFAYTWVSVVGSIILTEMNQRENVSMSATICGIYKK